MKAKKAVLTFYVPIRLELSTSQRWYSLSEASISIDLCRHKVNENAEQKPFWHRANPVQEIVQQTIKED